MKLRILAFGTRMPSWVEQGCAEYQKRLPPAYAPELTELATAKGGSGKTTAQLVADEDKRMLAAIARGDRVVALDQRGSNWTTAQLAAKLADWQQDGQDVSLLVGGPDGLGEQCRARAEQKWSLSGLTLPHPLVRIILFEQLYRAWAIQQGHPYHK